MISSSSALSSANIALKLLSSTASLSEQTASNYTARSSSPLMTSSENAYSISLSNKAAMKAYGEDSLLAKTLRSVGGADEVRISTTTIPTDKEAFRSEVLDFLKSAYKDDTAFQVALRDGTISIKTADEVPELTMQPSVNFDMIENGVTKGSGGFTPPGFNYDVYNDWAQSRNQSVGSVGNSQYYVTWPKS